MPALTKAVALTKTKGVFIARVHTGPRHAQKPAISAARKSAFQKILAKARVERAWYQDRQMMASQAIQNAISKRQLVKVDDVAGLVRIVHSTGGPSGVQYPYLTPESRGLLLGIAREFGIRRDALKLGKFFLSITSMTRDAERQEALRNEGYPAARQSTHGFGEAFDINVKFFRRNRHPHYRIILDVLAELHRKGAINFIDETAINGALHVARNPNYKGPLF